MKTQNTTLYPYYRKSLPATIFITLMFLLFSSFFAIGRGGISDLRSAALQGIAMAFSSSILFLIFHTGHVDRWRRIFFSAYAVAFVISFVWWTAGDRGICGCWIVRLSMLKLLCATW
jgi:hypothetical protein